MNQTESPFKYERVWKFRLDVTKLLKCDGKLTKVKTRQYELRIQVVTCVEKDFEVQDIRVD